jgi:hypothetical protein
MFVQLCDLCLKPLAMRAVFGRVNRLSLERGVFRPKRIDFLPKPIVFRSYVFALAHSRIVACRHELWGTRSNIYVRLMRSRTRIAGTANPTMSSTGGLRSSVLFRGLCSSVFFRGSELPKMMIGVQVRPTHPLRVGHSSKNRMGRPVGGCAARTQRRQKCLDIRNVGSE